MKIGNLYKHENNTDVALKVTNLYERPNGFSVLGMWINVVNPTNHYTIDQDLVFIKNEDVSKWKLLKLKD